MDLKSSLSAESRSMLEQTGALLEGHFKLSSGKHSPYYIQCALLFARPDLAGKASAQLAEKIRLAVDCTLAPALGGVVAGYTLAAALGSRALFAERPAGAFELRRGFSLRAGERVLIVEDVVTTGSSAKETADLARGLGARVVGYASFINRSGGSFAPPEPYFYWTAVDAPLYEPDACPLCATGSQAVKPGSRPEG